MAALETLVALARTATAPAFWFDKCLWVVLTTPEMTGGHYTLFDVTCPQGPVAAPHLHVPQDEAFYVAEGEAVFTVEGREIRAAAGDLAHVPRGAVHSFRVESPRARFLNFYAPGGFEPFILGAGTPAPARELPPRDLPMPDAARLRALAEGVGLRML